MIIIIWFIILSILSLKTERRWNSLLLWTAAQHLGGLGYFHYMEMFQTFILSVSIGIIDIWQSLRPPSAPCQPFLLLISNNNNNTNNKNGWLSGPLVDDLLIKFPCSSGRAFPSTNNNINQQSSRRFPLNFPPCLSPPVYLFLSSFLANNLDRLDWGDVQFFI